MGGDMRPVVSALRIEPEQQRTKKCVAGNGRVPCSLAETNIERSKLLFNPSPVSRMSSLTYLANLLKDPNIASIAPTSSFGIQRLSKKMDFSRPLTVVEYGPATGVITEALLKKLHPDSRVIAIDTNERFLEILRKRLPDPRLSIHHDSAANVLQLLNAAGKKHADYILSGIPFTMLPREVAAKIVADTHEALAPDGKFLVYQFLKPEARGARGIHTYLPNNFHDIKKEIEWMNIPPLWIYEATKRAS